MAANGPILTHLQFADDTIVFCNASLEELLNVKKLLVFFEVVSGLKINFQKSVVSGVGLSQDEMKSFADCLGCKHQSCPLKYLGCWGLVQERNPLGLLSLKIFRGSWPRGREDTSLLEVESLSLNLCWATYQFIIFLCLKCLSVF